MFFTFLSVNRPLELWAIINDFAIFGLTLYFMSFMLMGLRRPPRLGFCTKENPSVPQTRDWWRRPLLVRVKRRRSGPLLKCGPRLRLGSIGGSVTMVVPVPCAVTGTERDEPFRMLI